jgi:hypothetical protein
MLLSEQEAKERRCCVPRVALHCLGSACMAWQWAKDTDAQVGFCGVAEKKDPQ